MMLIDPISIVYGIVIGTVITAVVLLIVMYKEEHEKKIGERHFICLNCMRVSPPTDEEFDYCPYCGESYWIIEEDE